MLDELSTDPERTKQSIEGLIGLNHIFLRGPCNCSSDGNRSLSELKYWERPFTQPRLSIRHSL
ncbi:hypothetical protein RSAG8_10565, partial [Rhizoctonia solani AG-8 WAC10335]